MDGSMDGSTDAIVIGGGIAGLSIAYELSRSVRVSVLEMESTLAYHTTGRSAATFLETYGENRFERSPRPAATSWNGRRSASSRR